MENPTVKQEKPSMFIQKKSQMPKLEEAKGDSSVNTKDTARSWTDVMQGNQ